MFADEKEEVTLDTMFLAMRPGEQLHFSKIPYDGKPCFIVMLLETPPFPGESHNKSKSLSVICAIQHGIAGEYETDRWGWVHLEQWTKEVIGAGLERFDAQPNKWYCMLISGGIGHRPMSHFLSADKCLALLPTELTRDEMSLMIDGVDIQLEAIRAEKSTQVNETHYDRLQASLSLKSKLVTAHSKMEAKRLY